MYVVNELFTAIKSMGQVTCTAFAQMREQRDYVKVVLAESRLKVCT